MHCSHWTIQWLQHPYSLTLLGWWEIVREFKESYVEHVYSNINKIIGEGHLAHNNYRSPANHSPMTYVLSDLQSASKDRIFNIYPSFSLLLREHPCLLNSLSGTPALAATVAPPARRLWRPYSLGLSPIASIFSSSSSLIVV